MMRLIGVLTILLAVITGSCAAKNVTAPLNPQPEPATTEQIVAAEDPVIVIDTETIDCRTTIIIGSRLDTGRKYDWQMEFVVIRAKNVEEARRMNVWASKLTPAQKENASDGITAAYLSWIEYWRVNPDEINPPDIQTLLRLPTVTVAAKKFFGEKKKVFLVYADDKIERPGYPPEVPTRYGYKQTVAVVKNGDTFSVCDTTLTKCDEKFISLSEYLSILAVFDRFSGFGHMRENCIPAP